MFLWVLNWITHIFLANTNRLFSWCHFRFIKIMKCHAIFRWPSWSFKGYRGILFRTLKIPWKPKALSFNVIAYSFIEIPLNHNHFHDDAMTSKRLSHYGACLPRTKKIVTKASNHWLPWKTSEQKLNYWWPQSPGGRLNMMMSFYMSHYGLKTVLSI